MLFDDQIGMKTLRCYKGKSVERRQGPVVEKSNRRFIKLKAVGVLVIEVHLVACLFVLLFIEL